jgi:hypothetical protein
VSLHFAAVAAFFAVDLLLVAACLFALAQNAKLRREVAFDVALLTPAKGAPVPALVGEDWLGVTHTIAYGRDQRPTLVYAFSKHCAYCEQNWRAMRPFQALGPHSLRIIYIDTFGEPITPRDVAASGIGKSVLLVQLLSPAVAYAYDARAVPQAVLVGRDGRVQWSHVGELGRGDISKALSLITRD